MKQIEDDEFQMIMVCLARYNALMEAGVENWSGYEDAMNSIWEKDEDE